MSLLIVCVLPPLRVKNFSTCMFLSQTRIVWFPPPRFISTWFVTRITRRMALVERELCILPEHLGSPTVFNGVLVAPSLVFCVMLCTPLFVLCTFSFDHCVVCTSSFDHCVVCTFSFDHCVVCPLIYGFWLPPWYFFTIVLSVLLWLTASNYSFGIFKLVLCLYFGVYNG